MPGERVSRRCPGLDHLLAVYFLRLLASSATFSPIESSTVLKIPARNMQVVSTVDIVKRRREGEGRRGVGATCTDV